MLACLWFFGLCGVEQVLEAQMKADMADKEMLESGKNKYEEEVQEKCSIISEQKAVRTGQPAGDTLTWPRLFSHLSH